MTIFKIIPVADFSPLAEFIPSQPADDGCAFIHLCDENTIEKCSKKFFPGVELVVLEIDLEKVFRAGFDVKFEYNPGGSNQYWHFYRTGEQLIPMSAVIATTLMS